MTDRERLIDLIRKGKHKADHAFADYLLKKALSCHLASWVINYIVFIPRHALQTLQIKENGI